MSARTVEALRAELGERVSTGEALRAQHAGGEGFRPGASPEAVVFAESTAQVAAVLRRCAADRTPVIPFGAGTSLEGQLAAVSGGVALDLTRMDRVLEVTPGDLDCRVEAGVTREALNAELRDTGLMFTADPGANATLGGMASTRASGTNAVRYGTMRELVLGLTVVTPLGEVMRTGGKARKAATGYDLTALFVGAEGTLGVITELQLRLYGRPEAVLAAVCPFVRLEGAVEAVTLALQAGLPLARIELLDALQMRASIAYSKLDDLEAAPTLFLEFHGGEAAVAATAEAMAEIAEACGGGPFRWARRPEERSRLWKARHDAYWAARALAPGKAAFATDACVPVSRLAECVLESQAEAQASGLVCPLVGHVGDGNFHLLVLHDPADPREVAAAEALSDSIARRAIAAGGACSGEHGIGLHKRGHMDAQHGAPALAAMRALKAALDPHGIMNPGKLLPAPAGLRLAEDAA